ncbi:MAG: 23S rRNA (guanosine2251-2'-O)-methyltransferase [Bacteroidia bacterium]|jgi:23S rRNA (guanosine2251-2'-O)-methyltransferase
MHRKLKNIELNRLSVEEFKKADKLPICVLLDNVRSMLNVGSVFRTSDAFRIEHLYLCGITAKPPHRDITKSAIGAEQSVNWTHVKNASDVIIDLKSKGYVIISIEQTEKAVQLDDFSFEANKQYAVVLGNEVEGVTDEAISMSDHVIEIPQLGTKHSLNISVCAGVVLWEAAKPHLND